MLHSIIGVFNKPCIEKLGRTKRAAKHDADSLEQHQHQQLSDSDDARQRLDIRQTTLTQQQSSSSVDSWVVLATAQSNLVVSTFAGEFASSAGSDRRSTERADEQSIIDQYHVTAAHHADQGVRIA